VSDYVLVLWREFCRAERDMERLRIAHQIERAMKWKP